MLTETGTHPRGPSPLFLSAALPSFLGASRDYCAWEALANICSDNLAHVPGCGYELML